MGKGSGRRPLKIDKAKFESNWIKSSGARRMPIRKTKKGYKIDRVPGYSETKKEAEKRLRAVKASQAVRSKGK